MEKGAFVYLIPCTLEDAQVQTIPAYLKEAVQDCTVFFVENERSARRYLKKLWPQMVIDDYQWVTIHKAEQEVSRLFRDYLQQNQRVGIVSEAGCPGVADPGQILIAEAQRLGVIVRPLVGPSSLLLALMASGMNGQQFQFHGYLPIDSSLRSKKIHELEEESQRKNCTQLFIETPYRNNQLLENLLKIARPTTRLCLAVDITTPSESIKTKTIEDWKKQVPDLHKKPVTFLLLSS